MKILVVCQHYWPEPFQLSDVCESLVRRGHTVHVIADVPNYPEGYIYKDYKKDTSGDFTDRYTVEGFLSFLKTNYQATP